MFQLLMILLSYHHHSNGWWILAIPVVIILWYLLKFLFVLIAGGLSALNENKGKILGGLGKALLGTMGGIAVIFLYLLRLIMIFLILTAFMGGCAGILYFIGHQIAYWAEGVGILIGMGLGCWLFGKCSHKINAVLDRIFP